MTIEKDNLVGKQNNMETKMFSYASVSSDGMMGKIEKETMANVQSLKRQRNKGKGTYERRKASRMISIHRKMISWCFDSLDIL